MSYRVFLREDNLHYEGLGRGVFTDTSFYEGQWQRGFPHGYGVFSASNGSKFAGEWREEQLHGLAVLTNRLKGRQYEGDYVNGKCDGYGVFTVSSGERYAGHWCRDSYDGLGRFYSTDGTSEEGVWKCDEFVESADATDAVERAELAAKNAQKAAKIAEEKAIQALDAAELARQAQEAADAAELSASISEGRAYRALYQYEARSQDEASVEEGDIIVDAESVDDPLWFRGRVQRTGKTGLIPLEYVEQIVSEE